MGSVLGDWPSFDPHNFSQIRPSDPSNPSLIISMGSVLGNWPSFDPHNFSQIRPSDPSNPSKMTPATYHPTHDRTLPPPDQVISSEAKDILLRHIYQQAEAKLRSKRAACDLLTPDHGLKQPRASASENHH